MHSAEKCLVRVTEAACGVIAMWRAYSDFDMALRVLEKDAVMRSGERSVAAMLAKEMYYAEVSR
jgi:hypothetical protein